MNTRPEPAGRSRKASWQSDERGAIMVIGIFMCACVVGAMWYVAGIGDALLLRERVQEAADAAAFSGAALHARGMNLIVLLNLIMACILGLRVALKVVQLTLVILGAIFLALSWLGLGPLGGACMEAAGQLQNAIGQLNPYIDKALKALSKAEVGMARVAPAAACAGAIQVGRKYSPLVDNMFACVSAEVVTNGLPLQEGTADRLCFEAGKSFASLLGWALPIPGLSGSERFKDIMGKIIERGGAYFCEMGSGGGAPNLDDVLDGAAKEDCDHKRDEKVKKLNADTAAWQKKCSEYSVLCYEQDVRGEDYPYMEGDEQLKPDKRAELQNLLATRNASKEDLDAFRYDKCKEEQKKNLNNKVKSNAGSSSGSSSGNDMTPKMVVPKWKNGLKDTQIISWGDADLSQLRFGTQAVKIAAQRRATPDMSTPIAAGFAFAQAEYFYDCAGKWDSDDCNGNGERKDNEGAMWHFKWRARLRRYNKPYDDLPNYIELPKLKPAHAAMVMRASQTKLFSWSSPGNIQLKSQLRRFLNPFQTTDVALH